MDEFKKRFNAAKATRRQVVEGEGREVYKFCYNGRESEWDDRIRMDEENPDEIFSSSVATVSEEFTGELFSTMTPENTPWVEYEAGNAVDEGISEQADTDLQEFEKIISKSVRSSNYYDEGPTSFMDAVFGNVAMWIDRPTLSGPVVCRAQPISKLFLRIGPMGLEDRFVRDNHYYSDLPAVFPKATFSREMQKKIKESKGQARIVWGFWRNYADPSNPVWRQEIRVDDEKIGLDVDLGSEGSCPLIVGRFNPVPGSPWGRGPARRMLPDLRALDELVRMNLEGMDRNLDPAFAYPHDGMLDLSDGIESGLGYPAMPGSPEQITPIGMGNLDYGFFSEERMIEIIRDGFYREIEQKGKTPPSATQFMGQEQKQIRRMARPAGKTWREFGVGLLKRFEWIESQPGGMLDGSVPELIHSGTVIARPISPLERAQAREDVLVAQSIMGMAREGLGEQQAGLLIDGEKTFRNVKQVLKDKVVEFRSKEEIQQILEMMQPQQNAQPQA